MYTGVQNRFYSEQPYTIHLSQCLYKENWNFTCYYLYVVNSLGQNAALKITTIIHCDNPFWRVSVWGIQEANAMSNRLRNFLSTTFLILKNLRIWSQYKFIIWKKQLASSFEGEMDTPWTDKVTSQFYFILCCLTLIVTGVVYIHTFF